MEVLIVYDGQRGRTRKAAAAMARVAAAAEVEPRILPIDMTTPDVVARADALLAGCWVKGNAPFGGRQFEPMAKWMERLPEMDGKPTGAFCTYGFFPMFFADAVAHTGEALARLREGLEDKGAKVVATHAIHRRSPDEGASEFVTSVLDHL